MKRIAVLYENAEVLILDKPAGLAVQGGEKVGASLDKVLAAEFSPAPLLVHRLDRDTSGAILVAKNREAAAKYAALFAERGGEAEKRYLAAVAGVPPESGTIAEDIEAKGRALHAATEYRRLASGSFGDRDYALVELELKTGRTHQIRIHLAKLGFPVLGDGKYGDFQLNKELKKTAGLKRMLLHAASLSLPGLPPADAPLPDYFRAFLEKAGIVF